MACGVLLDCSQKVAAYAPERPIESLLDCRRGDRLAGHRSLRGPKRARRDEAGPRATGDGVGRESAKIRGAASLHSREFLSPICADSVRESYEHLPRRAHE